MTLAELDAEIDIIFKAFKRCDNIGRLSLYAAQLQALSSLRISMVVKGIS